ncbi:hypothetical protein [Geomonas subterranea]|uniref:hypothetical protein n=1 Tax=Geomonas subterranea TaxID=2847989 RepID=UPI001CD54C09|nr:hypothetical protein [Geomonas fuzhouensis]
MEFKGFPPEEDIEDHPVDLAQGIISTGGLIHCHLKFSMISAAKLVYEDLKWFLEEFDHEQMVAIVNKAGVTSESAGWIVKAWCDVHGIKNSVLEFDTAWCVGTPGESMNYRRTKKTWGDLVSVQEDEEAPKRLGRTDEGALRMQFYLKPNNPIRLKQTTRNELKLILGSAAVASAMRSRKEEFIAGIDPIEVRRIERVTGLPIGKIWSSIKSGNQELVDRLGTIPNSKRRQMAKRGMFVANHIEPQLALFN